MKTIRMLETRSTDAGLLKQGKNYPVPDDVADELVEAGVAVDLDSPEPERAVSGPSEDAARQSKRKTRGRVVSESVSDSASADDE